MKILDILHLQGPSAMYLAEIVYFVHMTIWGYCRLYLFPKNLLYYGVYGTIFMRKSPEGNTYWSDVLHNTMTRLRLLKLHLLSTKATSIQSGLSAWWRSTILLWIAMHSSTSSCLVDISVVTNRLSIISSWGKFTRGQSI